MKFDPKTHGKRLAKSIIEGGTDDPEKENLEGFDGDPEEGEPDSISVDRADNGVTVHTSFKKKKKSSKHGEPDGHEYTSKKHVFTDADAAAKHVHGHVSRMLHK